MDRMKRFSGRWTLVFLVFTIVASSLLAACGGSSSDDISIGTSAPAAGMSSYSGDAMAMAESEEEDAAPADWGNGEEGRVSPQTEFSPDRLVIRTATITLAVENTIEATTSVRNIAATKGGFVFSSTTYVDHGHNYAQLTIRIPSDRFDDTVSELRSAGWVDEVIREESGSQDVSGEFVDNESRLAALEETQRRYMELLSEASTIDEILRLESELTNIRTQIESIRGRQNYLSEMTSFSTISVNLRPSDDSATPEPDDDNSLWGIIESAWDRSTGALAGVAEAIMVIAIFAAFFAPIGFLVWLVYRFIRRRLRRANEPMPTLPQGD